ncbi:MAG: hypothetical protein QOD81_2844, partial [Solirubrobacteraceae bacterium]|nr:hypothetical protein [Solirubrobacteraceae bacterium]
LELAVALQDLADLVRHVEVLLARAPAIELRVEQRRPAPPG